MVRRGSLASGMHKIPTNKEFAIAGKGQQQKDLQFAGRAAYLINAYMKATVIFETVGMNLYTVMQ